MTAAMAPSEDHFTSQYSMFEGLFDRVLKPEGAFLEALKAAGYDPATPKPVYPMAVWHRCLDVVAKHRFAQLPTADAYRATGRAFMAGFFETLVGRLIAAALPFLSPKTFVQRSPRFLRTGVNELETELEWLSDTKARVVMHGPHADACFVTAGVIEVSFERLRVPVRVEGRNLPNGDNELTIDWS